MDLGDRVYAAERITKKREKRVSIVSFELWRPDGATKRNPLRASLPPLSIPPTFSFLSLLPSPYPSLSLADSRLPGYLLCGC